MNPLDSYLSKLEEAAKKASTDYASAAKLVGKHYAEGPEPMVRTIAHDAFLMGASLASMSNPFSISTGLKLCSALRMAIRHLETNRDGGLPDGASGTLIERMLTMCSEATTTLSRINDLFKEEG